MPHRLHTAAAAQSSTTETKALQSHGKTTIGSDESGGGKDTEGVGSGQTREQPADDDMASIDHAVAHVRSQTNTQYHISGASEDRSHPKRWKLSPTDNFTRSQQAQEHSIQHQLNNLSVIATSTLPTSNPIEAEAEVTSSAGTFQEPNVELAPQPVPIEAAETQDPQRQDLEGQNHVDDSHLCSSKPTDGEQSEVDNSRSSPMTPPKKMMKLRKDGRLLSPKSPKEAPPKLKKGRPMKKTPIPDKKIVTVRYDCTRNSRARVGKEIDSVLSGALRITRPVKSKPTESPKKHSHPPKIIHPFFLGPVASKLPAESQDTRPSSAQLNSQKHQKSHATGESTAAPLFKSNFSESKIPRPPRLPLPPWPSPSTLHCRDSNDNLQNLRQVIQTPALSKLVGKSKEARIVLDPSEELVAQYLPGSFRQESQAKAETHHKPVRRVVSTKELRDSIAESLSSRSFKTLGLPAVSRIFDSIKSFTSAFDRFECENEDWNTKYAPKRVADVLQPGFRMDLLREWLLSLTVNAVEGVNSHKEALKPMRKKKRRKLQGLDDFIVDADEVEDDETSDSSCDFHQSADQPTNNPKYCEDLAKHRGFKTIRKLKSRNLRSTRAVIISGPHGCGKTAFVYAVAEELGFEVFEINSGSRRSGRDVLDKVGDMTRNHLVNRGVGTEEELEVGDDNIRVQEEIESGRQSAIQAFFKPQADKLASGMKTEKEPRKPAPDKSTEKATKQRQSLILLEEVDVLFEEDRNFWGTVVSLLESSRRPIVMTCTDDSLLPYNELLTCSMLRLSPPQADTTVDYLLSMAALEGHILSREAVDRLYAASHHDLRCTIQQLQFWCQMALGDPKGGLDWMLLKSDVQTGQDLVRVMSDGTYQPNLGLLSSDEITRLFSSIDHDIGMLHEAMDEWSFDAEDWTDWIEDSHSRCRLTNTSKPKYEQLLSIDTFHEAISAGDIMPGSRAFEYSLLDATQDEITEKARANYTCGYPLLQADLAQDENSISKEVVLALKLCARDVAFASRTPLDRNDLCQKIVAREPDLCTRQARLRNILTTALEPLAPIRNDSIDAKPISFLASENRLSTLATDIAPYVRFIVSYDLRLEQERLRLSNLLSEGGRVGKRQRKTRASMAALEGGSKADTRRERWFTNELNFSLVLETGGEGWQEAQGKAEERIVEKVLGGG